jgi:hypothetical protein
MARHRDADRTESERSSKFTEGLIGVRAAGGAVGNQADLVASPALAAYQIDYVAKQSAYRRTQHMQNAQRTIFPFGYGDRHCDSG